MKQSTIQGAGQQGRLIGLKRDERDLRERVSVRVSALKRAGRWHQSDPLYQSLWFALARVRQDLKKAQTRLA